MEVYVLKRTAEQLIKEGVEEFGTKKGSGPSKKKTSWKLFFADCKFG